MKDNASRDENIAVVLPNDIILQRPINPRFRDILVSRLLDYTCTRKSDRGLLLLQILNQIERSSYPPARFLKKVSNGYRVVKGRKMLLLLIAKLLDTLEQQFTPVVQASEVRPSDVVYDKQGLLSQGTLCGNKEFLMLLRQTVREFKDNPSQLPQVATQLVGRATNRFFHTNPAIGQRYQTAHGLPDTSIFLVRLRKNQVIKRVVEQLRVQLCDELTHHHHTSPKPSIPKGALTYSILIEERRVQTTDVIFSYEADGSCAHRPGNVIFNSLIEANLKNHLRVVGDPQRLSRFITHRIMSPIADIGGRFLVPIGEPADVFRRRHSLPPETIVYGVLDGYSTMRAIQESFQNCLSARSRLPPVDPLNEQSRAPTLRTGARVEDPVWNPHLSATASKDGQISFADIEWVD